MQALPDTLSIAQEIQLSVAPVFMLTAIAALLTLLFNRMSQTHDQIRALGELPEGEGPAPRPDKAMSAALATRIRRIQWAIRCNVTAAILICAVVVSIFISDYLVPDLSNLIAPCSLQPWPCLPPGSCCFCAMFPNPELISSSLSASASASAGAGAGAF